MSASPEPALGQPPQASLAETLLTAPDAPAVLKPSMHGFGALLITISCLSPSIGVFVVGSDVIRQAGSAVFLCFVAAALLGVAMAAVYGELAAAFPGPGGEYTILTRALGPPFGFAALALNLLGFSVAQSLSALGVASYLQPLLPGLPLIPAALGLVAVVTAIGVLDVRVGAWVTGVFLAVELLSLCALAALGFQHPHRPVASVLHPVMLDGAGALAPVALAVAGSATAGAIYAFNGYGSVVFLGEEMHEASRRMARVVYLALAAAAVTELAPLLAVLVGAPDLKALISAKSPIPAFIAGVAGPAFGQVMSLGVALAIFNAMIAVALMAGRQLFSTGRDGLWPEPVSRFFARVHPGFGSPLNATLAMGLAALVGCLVDPRVLVLILGNGNVVLYAGLCAAAMRGRRSGATRHGPYRMPLFPLPPLAALIALAAVIWFDLHDRSGAEGLGATAITLMLAFLYHRLRGARGGGPARR